MSLHFTTHALTDTGVTRSANQDAVLDHTNFGLWAVADGMGGHIDGDRAANAVIDALGQLSGVVELDQALDQVCNRIAAVNNDLLTRYDSYPENQAPGTTLAALLIRQDQGMVTWIGDSRVYRARDGHLSLLTHDHSHVQDLVDDGQLKPEDAERHPMASVITRAIGLEPTLALDHQGIDVRAGDRFLICSDGLNRVLPDAEIGNTLKITDGLRCVEALLAQTLAAGAPDNVSMVCISCHATQ